MATAPKESVKVRLERLAKEYGSVAIATWFGLFALVLAGFATAIKFGVEVEGAAGNASILGAAYVATKLTTPLRIGATVVLTPIVARVLQRIRPNRALPPSPPSSTAVTTTPPTTPVP